MAKTPKTATVLSSVEVAPGFHRVDCLAAEPLGHVAGNYIIPHSSLPHPEKEGQIMKKAYSIATAPDLEDPRRFAVVVAEVGDMSRWLAALREGDTLRFSGPWGRQFKFFDGDAAPLHLLATGSGFSPIGALAEAWRCSGRPGPVRLWWEIDQPYASKQLDMLRADPRFTVVVGPDVARRISVDSSALYMLAGDGRVILEVIERLEEAGVSEDRVRTEYFFNRPPKPEELKVSA